MISARWLLAGLLIVSACTADTLTPGTPTAPQGGDPLTILNADFRAAYRAARTRTLSATDPIIVVQFDDLHLIRGTSIRTETFTPPIYHQYKAIAHIPLALHVMLMRPVVSALAEVADEPNLDYRTLPRPFDEETLSGLRDYRAHVVAARASLDGRPGWDSTQLTLHRRIADGGLALIDRALATRAISAGELTAYARANRADVLASADAAGRAQLDGLHALMTRWRAELGPAWDRAEVVVLGPRQPRVGNLQFLYFERLMGRAAVDRRLFYAEGVFTREGGVDLLGTILLDRGASIGFFGDPRRLERDLLEDAARRHLDRLFPRR